MTSRIALTTSPDRGESLASRCGDLGLEPVLLPCIQFVPADICLLGSVRDEATRADWLAVTSARAVTALWPQGGMPDVPVAVVGESTARTVREAGGNPAVVGDGGAAELVDLVSGRIGGKTVLFPHAAGAGRPTARALEGAGASVVARPVYEIRPVPPAVDPVDAVAFGSPTAVRGWCLSRDFDGLVVGAIGETTAAEIARQSARVDVVAPRPAFDRLIDLIAEHLNDRSAV